jgi:Cullin protein neddylation domain
MRLSVANLTESYSLLQYSRKSIKKVSFCHCSINHLEVIAEDRSIAIEAALVRIMKSRKTLDHNNLVQEVLQSLKNFKPNPQHIKAKIDQLIDREYLERDGSDKNIYKYLA